MQAPFRKLITSYAVPCAAICIVAGSVFILGVAQGGYAKDNDARYLYAAAKCWSAGQSPYIAQVFSSKYHAIFGARTASEFFAYPPTVMTIALPLSLFSWPVAAKVFSLANFAAAMVLFGACYRLVREELGHALYPSQWFWVVLASTLNGVTITVFSGQTSVFVSAAVALVLVGWRCQHIWPTVIGFTIAGIKPQVSAPVLLLIPWLERRQRIAALVGVGIWVGLLAYAVAVDPQFVHTYLNSVNLYRSAPENDVAYEFGLVPLLMTAGMGPGFSQTIGFASAVLVFAGIIRFVLRSGRRITGNPVALMLMSFSIAVALPIHRYDLCCYAPGIALIATLKRRYQLLLALPAMLVCHPGLINRLDFLPVLDLLSMLAWLSLLVFTCATFTAGSRFARTQPVEPSISGELGEPGLDSVKVDL